MGSKKGTQRRRFTPAAVAFPWGKVARASSASARRMRAMGEVPLEGAERAYFCPLSHFVTAPPEWEPRGTDCDRMESPEGAHQRLPCVKGAGSRVSRKRKTEGL